jgi:hypothetical protein
MNQLNRLKRLPPVQLVRKWQFQVERQLSRSRGRPVIHFLHIGKTAGTAIRNAFHGRHHFKSSKALFVIHHHGTRLCDIPKTDGIFFVVRDPVSRFVSGFYSRLRKGQPRIFNPWTEDEAIAFTNFPTPNLLGESLSSNSVDVRDQASSAMRSIGHVRNSYWDWFGDKLLLASCADRIVWVGRQEKLGQDFYRLKDEFELPESMDLPADKVKSHRNPESFDKSLSELAVKNLREWYAMEYEFISCLIKHKLLQPEYVDEMENIKSS